MNKITIQELCEKIEREILSMKSVESFYIGKTDNIDRRTIEHDNEGYQVTKIVATGEPEMINDAERYVIAYFKKKGDTRIKNNGPGGEGPDGKSLYISLKFNIKDMYEIEELDIEFNIQII